MKKFSPLARVAAVVTAVVLVGGGASVAANQITGGQIAKNTIKSRNIKDGTLKSKDLSAAAKSELKGNTGATGAQGPAGATGPAGPAGSGVSTISDFTGPFAPNAADTRGLSMTGDGVQFGPFANGGACDVAGQDYARLNFTGLNGKTLSQVTRLNYTTWFVADNDTGGVGSPTLRITLSTNDRLTFSPNTQFNGDNRATGAYDSVFNQGEVHEYLVTHGTLRANDDAGGVNPDLTFAKQAAAFPSATITKIDILNGCQNGKNLTSVLREFKANGADYVFGKN